MITTELSPLERRALQGLLSHPGFRDRAVAERLGMGLSSLVSARLRLERAGYLRTVAVPAYQRLGAEFLAVSYTHHDSIPLSDAVVARFKEAIGDTEVSSLLVETSHCMFVQFARNYTDARRNVDAVEGVYQEHGSLLRGFTTAIFPFDMSMLASYFDYSRLPGGPEAGPGASPAWGPDPFFAADGRAELTPMGERVLLGILDNPSKSNTDIAREIGASRMTVGKWRGALLGDGVVSLRREAALERLGMEVLVLTHGRFSKDLSRGLRRFMPDLMGTVGPLVLAVLGGDEILVLSAFPSFLAYREANDAFMSKLREHELFAAPPERVVFSVRGMHAVRSQDHGPPVRRLLARGRSIA